MRKVPANVSAVVDLCEQSSQMMLMRMKMAVIQWMDKELCELKNVDHSQKGIKQINSWLLSLTF